MAHNDDPVALLHQVAQRMRDDPCPHPGPLLGGIRLAAIEGQPLACLDGGLVTASAERHIKARLGQSAELAGGLGAEGKADAKRHRHLQIGRHFPDFVQNDEPALLQRLQAAVVQKHQIPLRRQAAQVYIELSRPVGNFTCNLRDQRGSLLVIHSLSGFVKVIHQKDAKSQLLLFITLPQINQIGDFEQIQQPFARYEHHLIVTLVNANFQSDVLLNSVLADFPLHGRDHHRPQIRQQIGQQITYQRFPRKDLSGVAVTPFDIPVLAIQNNAQRQSADRFAFHPLDAESKAVDVLHQIAPK
ncbi:hypothetical protein D3C71_1272590 [compost metagenome]